MNAFLGSVSMCARRSSAFLLALVWASVCAADGPVTVERFDLASWEQLQKDLPRPAAIVFTATYCANCPAVLEKLSGLLVKHGLDNRVIAVVIDEAEERELLASRHYTHAARLFLFQGNEAALRYRIDPRWRGVTPFIALLPAGREPIFATGAPSEQQLDAWLRK